MVFDPIAAMDSDRIRAAVALEVQSIKTIDYLFIVATSRHPRKGNKMPITDRSGLIQTLQQSNNNAFSRSSAELERQTSEHISTCEDMVDKHILIQTVEPRTSGTEDHCRNACLT